MTIDDLLAKVLNSKRQIEFLKHILNSAKEYDHKDFDEVKSDVVAALDKFVADEILRIESSFNTAKPTATPVVKTPVSNEKPQEKAKAVKKPDPAQSGDILSFAMKHRSLSGKKVETEQGVGTVLGINYPYLVIQKDSGEKINVLPSELVK